MTNKKGISDFITTLIMIVIILVVVGVIWYMIQNILNQGGSEINQGMEDLFGDCVADYSGKVMINITHTKIDTLCDTELNQVKAINGKYCCIPLVV